MISLLSNLFQWLLSQQKVNIVILGLDHAGKTTFMEQCKMIFGQKKMSLHKIPPTVGLNVAKLDVQNTIVTIWDLGGQSSFRKIWPHYSEMAHGIIFVVDSCNEERFVEAREELKKLCKERVPIVVLVNKIDRDESRLG